MAEAYFSAAGFRLFGVRTLLNYCVWGEFNHRGAVMNRMDPHRIRFFLGGSDARIGMGNDEKALLRLWQEKRPS